VCVELFNNVGHIERMSMTTKSTRKNSQSKGYRVAGVTRDGVKILATGRATHFTDKEIRDSISTVLRESRAGRFAESSTASRKP
jgi:hypothetical protein